MARPTKLEEIMFKIHLDIDGEKADALDHGVDSIRQMVGMIIGQTEIESHDVDLVVQVLVTERKPKGG